MTTLTVRLKPSYTCSRAVECCLELNCLLKGLLKSSEPLGANFLKGCHISKYDFIQQD